MGPPKGREVGQELGLDGEPGAFPLSDTFAEFEADLSRRRTREGMSIARQGKIGRQAAQTDGQTAAGIPPHARHGRVFHQRDR